MSGKIIKAVLIVTLLFTQSLIYGQKDPQKNAGAPSQKEVDAMMKQMQDAMKGLSPEEKAQMEKVMKGMMTGAPGDKPVIQSVSFSDNKKLIPKKDPQRIAKLNSKPLTKQTLPAYTAELLSKLNAKILPAQKTIAATAQAKSKNANALMTAAVMALMQGHNEASMLLALKAVQSAPNDPGHQTNLAAILSQSGYPEKAMPYLRKLSNEYPGNSTVLHNLGFAWLQLGEVDSASRFFGAAAIRNQNNPETKICQGVIAEAQGDPQKAAEAYKEAFELSPHPFTADLIKNASGNETPGLMDFDELKKHITIYEYFDKDWVKTPVMEDNVEAYNKNSAIRNGYDKMFEQLSATLQELSEGSSQDLSDLADGSLQNFVNTLMKENQKGINVMSKPAAFINMMLMGYIAEWQPKFMQERLDMVMKMEEARNRMTQTKPGEKCQSIDQKANAYMNYANPLIREFYVRKLEEYRVWLNALCTWAPYVTGNPKNMVMTQCLSYAGFYVTMLQMAVTDQQVLSPTCNYQAGDDVKMIYAPEIPNLQCKSAVKMPAGNGELQFTMETSSVNTSPWGISNNTNTPIPNFTMSFGINGNVIGEPGRFGRPFVKTGGNSIAPSSASAYEELTPLTKILDHLEPLDPMLLPEEKKEKLQKAEARSDAKLSRELFNKMMNRDCSEHGKQPKLKISSIEFESYIAWDAATGKWVQMPAGENPADYKKLGIEFIKCELSWEEMESIPELKSKEFILGVGFIEFENAAPSPAAPVKTAESQVIKSIQDGFRTVISNGLGTIGRTVRSLFE